MDMRWYSLLLATAFYVVASWIFLALAGETELTQSSNYIYWILVTASTVGYGDFSPTTVAGKWIVSLFVIPFGLGLFGILLGRLAATFSFQWRKGVKGLSQINTKNHIIVVGWNENRTLQLIRMLQREIDHNAPQEIVLCVMADIENPLPDEIGFVKVSHFTNASDMARTNLAEAATVILDNPDDDTTLATALFVSGENSSAHIIAYFKQDNMGELLKKHCPRVEAAPSVAIEMLAKAAMDPGSSTLHHQLLNVHQGMTQYSATVESELSLPLAAVFEGFKQRHNATLIAISKQGQSMEINPSLEETIRQGDVVYYIAADRIKPLDWSVFSV